MRNRLPLTALFSVSLFLGAAALPVARAAEDQPANAKPATPPGDAPARPENGGGGGGLQFPMLQRVRSAVDELKLSDEQKTKIESMFETARSELKAAREDAAGDRKAVAQKARETFNKLRDNLLTVLDEDQKAQLREKLKSLTQRGGDVIARLRAALEKLNLGGDQKRDLHDLLDAAETKAKDLREKAQAGDEDAREKLTALMRETRKKIADVLTDNQKQKLQEELGTRGQNPNP